MARQMTKTNQSFEQIVSNDCFYVDKTIFIKDWRKANEPVITRQESLARPSLLAW